MGYVAVKGGSEAIAESIQRLKYERIKNGTVLDTRDIESGMRGLIDTVMSESSLYDRQVASVAIKQAEGSIEEAVFLMRAYRSTLPRKYYSNVIDTKNMFVERRISASFKDIPGGQILGTTYDYTHRLIDFDLSKENTTEVEKWLDSYRKTSELEEPADIDLCNLPRVTDMLRKEGIIAQAIEDNTPPIDVTKKNIEFPTKRSERLQVLTRGQTGAVIALGYASLRGFGDLHPTVGELRVGYVDICIANPMGDDEFYIGNIQITEVESYISSPDKNNADGNKLNLTIGYGVCYGQNESKAIAMSILDTDLETQEKKFPTQDEEFVLYHIDSVEATGFISHLKLPHYVTFKSKLDGIRRTREAREK